MIFGEGLFELFAQNLKHILFDLNLRNCHSKSQANVLETHSWDIHFQIPNNVAIHL